MVRALISGGAGFIGSHLTRRCVSLGWDVTVVDDMSSGRFESIQDLVDTSACRFMLGDFSSAPILEAVRAGRFDVVFHLAAQARVPFSVEFPILSHETNVEKTLRLIDACRSARHKPRFVFSSSSSVYGDLASRICMPVSEEMHKLPLSPYALQKSIVEDYLSLYWELYGLDSVSLRYFNVFGPGQLGDSQYSTAIAAWLTAIHDGKPMRSDGDGSQSRDLCYVDNVVDANVAAATHSPKLMATVFNVACGESHSNAEIIAHLRRRFPSASVVDAPPRAGDVKMTLANVDRLTSVLGVGDRIGFWDGLERTIAWHVERATQRDTVSAARSI